MDFWSGWRPRTDSRCSTPARQGPQALDGVDERYARHGGEGTPRAPSPADRTHVMAHSPRPITSGAARCRAGHEGCAKSADALWTRFVAPNIVGTARLGVAATRPSARRRPQSRQTPPPGFPSSKPRNLDVIGVPRRDSWCAIPESRARVAALLDGNRKYTTRRPRSPPARAGPSSHSRYNVLLSPCCGTAFRSLVCGLHVEAIARFGAARVSGWARDASVAPSFVGHGFAQSGTDGRVAGDDRKDEECWSVFFCLRSCSRLGCFLVQAFTGRRRTCAAASNQSSCARSDPEAPPHAAARGAGTAAPVVLGRGETNDTMTVERRRAASCSPNAALSAAEIRRRSRRSRRTATWAPRDSTRLPCRSRSALRCQYTSMLRIAIGSHPDARIDGTRSRPLIGRVETADGLKARKTSNSSVHFCVLSARASNRGSKRQSTVEWGPGLGDDIGAHNSDHSCAPLPHSARPSSTSRRSVDRIRVQKIITRVDRDGAVPWAGVDYHYFIKRLPAPTVRPSRVYRW